MQVLAAIGLCLVVLALVLRGAASSLRRQLARERQHERATGQPGESDRLVRQERAVARAALIALVLGVALTVVGLAFR
ncbi:MAG: hypothetical protein C0506_17140 [Anaerolinea sp.]|nr:hypothetical protein [Anaerolinea sp.]